MQKKFDDGPIPFAPQANEDPNTRTRQDRKAATRDKVILAAREKFLTLGFERATIRDIARAAGVASGTVSGQYGSKTGLFSAVLREEHEASYLEMLDADDVTLPARTRLSRVFRALFRYHCGGLDLMRAAIQASWQQQGIADPANRDALTRIHALLCAIMNSDREIAARDNDKTVLVAAQNLIELYIVGYQRTLFAGWSEQQSADRFEIVLDLTMNALKNRMT